MTELLTAAQMRAIEQAAIESGEVTGLELMERAGRGVVEAIFEEWPELADTSSDERAEAGEPAHRTPRGISGQKKHRAVVLCGPGNNGGDGFVVARLLRERGWEVEVFLFGGAETLPPDAKVNYERWREIGACNPWGDLDAKDVEDTGAELFVDAVFGTGLTRPIPADVGKILHLASTHIQLVAKTVAVDLPSGLCSDSGTSLVEDIPGSANLTVSFHSAKPGHFLHEGLDRCGRVRIQDIGLSRTTDLGSLTRQTLATLHSEKRLGRVVCHLSEPSPRLAKEVDEHKYDHGHALILSGPPGKGGAARLAARGALRVGAGLVTIGCPMRGVSEHAAHLNAIMVHGLDGTHGLGELLEDKRLNALCLGPGLGLGPSTGELVLNALKSGRATVLDADALSRFQRNPQVLFDACHENVVLTPHGGEFARLFPDLAEKLSEPATIGPAYSKVDATREAAARAGCVVLFKGADTVIAAPNGRCSINAAVREREAPWLATAGAGDVLAGIITGLMARGFGAMEAAETGAWLHVEAARSFGPGLIAEDLPEELPKVFRAMGL